MYDEDLNTYLCCKCVNQITYETPTLLLAGIDDWFLNKTRALHTRANNIRLYNCVFDEDYWLVIHGAVFEGDFSFAGCERVKAIFENCTFKKAVRFHATSSNSPNSSIARSNWASA